MNALHRLAHLFAMLFILTTVASPSGLLQMILFQPHESPAARPPTTLYMPIIALPREPIGIITTPAELRATKALADQGLEPSQEAVRQLLRDADDGLLFAPCAVASYTSEGGKDCLNGSSRYAFVLALAYRLTYDPRYATHAGELIRAWYTTLVAIDPQPPNDTKQPWLDWSRWAPAMTWGADLLEGAPGWDAADRQQLSAMLVSKVLDMGRKASERTNNWADAGNVLRLTIAIYADLPDERAAAIASWKLKIDGLHQPDGSWAYGMAADGSLPEENRREHSGLAYNQVALSSKTVFAELLRRRGDPSLYAYTTPRGVGLKNGWDFLAPRAVSAYNGGCDWPYTADHCVDYSSKTGWEIAYARWHEPAYLGPIGLERPYRWVNISDPSYSTLLFVNLNLGE